MNAALKTSTAVVWHHRILGTFWALVGVASAVGPLVQSSWNEVRIFMIISIAALFVGISVGFIFGAMWARRVMGILMLIAALFFLDMLLMFGVHANHWGVRMTLAALGMVAYTLMFLVISALNHPNDHDGNHVA